MLMFPVSVLSRARPVVVRYYGTEYGKHNRSIFGSSDSHRKAFELDKGEREVKTKKIERSTPRIQPKTSDPEKNTIKGSFRDKRAEREQRSAPILHARKQSELYDRDAYGFNRNSCDDGFSDGYRNRGNNQQNGQNPHQSEEREFEEIASELVHELDDDHIPGPSEDLPTYRFVSDRGGDHRGSQRGHGRGGSVRGGFQRGRREFDRNELPTRNNSNRETYNTRGTQSQEFSSRETNRNENNRSSHYSDRESFVPRTRGGDRDRFANRSNPGSSRGRFDSPRANGDRERFSNQRNSSERYSSSYSSPQRYQETSQRPGSYSSNRNSQSPPWKQEKVKISAEEIVKTLHWFGSSAQASNDWTEEHHLETLHNLFTRSPGALEASPMIRDYTGEYLYGLHSVSSAIARARREIHGLLTDKHPKELATLSPAHEYIVKNAIERKIPIVRTSTGRLEQLSGGFGNRHRSAILVCSPFQPHSPNILNDYDPSANFMFPSDELLTPPHRYTLQDLDANGGRMPLWMAIDRIQDPHNMGAILRSAWFYGVDGIILPLKDSCPVNATCANISTGAVEQLPIYYCRNLGILMKLCTENEWQTIGTFSSSETDDMKTPVIPLHDLTIKKPTIIAFGNEGYGVSNDILRQCSRSVQIPSLSPAANARYEPCCTTLPLHEENLSLNVGVAAGIILDHCTSFNNKS